jgi:hypothetical protein
MSRPSRHVVWEQFVLFELCLLSTSKWMQNLGKSRVPDIAWYAVFYCLLNVWSCIMGGKRKDLVLITIWWVNFNCRAPRSGQVISVMRVMMDLDETFQQLYILLKVHVPVAFCMYLSLLTFLVRENCMKDWCQLSFGILSLQLQNLKPILRFTQLMLKCFLNCLTLFMKMIFFFLIIFILVPSSYFHIFIITISLFIIIKWHWGLKY